MKHVVPSISGQTLLYINSLLAVALPQTTQMHAVLDSQRLSTFHSGIFVQLLPPKVIRSCSLQQYLCQVTPPSQYLLAIVHYMLKVLPHQEYG